ncbi:MAG TPA: family 16 glycoside hydrolase [Ktedonobacteraceae bacterium]|nr:family 16 glycoside hydrolase [Ktedonobacteraceae bacterium]
MANKHKFKGIVVGLSVVSACLLYALLIGNSYFLFQAQSNSSAKTIRVTPLPTPTTAGTNQPLFFDNFANASKGWSLGSVSGYSRSIDNSALTLADANHKTLTESLPTNTHFDDFIVTVSFTLLQASNDDSVGLYVRGDSNLDHDYRIDIYGDNSFAINKELLDSKNIPRVRALVNQTKTSAIHPPGQQNNITVAMKGSLLVLRINGSVIDTVIDTDYTTGQIALFVQNSNSSSGVEAAFSSVAVYPAPQKLPSS